MTTPAPREHASSERDRRLFGWQAYDWMKTAVALVLAALLLYGIVAGENDSQAATAIQPPDVAVVSTAAATQAAPTATPIDVPTALVAVAPTAALMPTDVVTTVAPSATSLPAATTVVTSTSTATEPRPADVIVVTDVSGSMAANNKMAGVREALSGFADLLSSQDRVELITFGDEATVVLPLTPVEEARDEVKQIARGLTPGGATTLYDTTLLAFDEMQRNGDPSHTRVIIVLTDGRDERLNANDESIPGSEATLEQTLASIQGGARQGITLFTIGYGANADNAMLQRMAAAANGQHFVAGPSTIQDVYQTIARSL